MRYRNPLLDKAILPAVGAYVLSHRLDALVAVLSCFRFMTQRHVERILFEHTDLTSASRTMGAWKLLTRALETKRVSRFRYDGRYVYHLAKNKPRGTAYIPHELLVTEAILLFLEEARDRGHDLYQIEMGLDLWGVRPDAYFVYGTDRTLYHFFLELDTGSMNARAWQKKVEGYVKLYRSGKYEEMLSVFPSIIVVTLSGGRSTMLKRATEKGRGNLQFSFASLDDLRSQGPLGPVWLRAGHEEKGSLWSEPSASYG